MAAERPVLASLSIPGSTNILLRPNNEPEQHITALPQLEYGKPDTWASARRQSIDTLDGIASPINPPAPARAQNPAVPIIEQGTEPSSSSSAPPPYSVQNTHRQATRFPVKAKNAPSAQPQSRRANATTVNGATDGSFDDVELGTLGQNDDVERQKIAVQYKGMAGAYPLMKRKLIGCAVFAVVVSIIVIVVGLEMRKKHPDKFGKI